MKNILFITLLLVTTFSFSQDTDWVKTEGEVLKITQHRGKWLRSSAVIKFNLENGAEQLGTTEILRIPFIGGINSVGDTITIHYNRNNPTLVKTTIGRFISNYGIYVLIILGVILSIKPFLKKKRVLTSKKTRNYEV
ncbi:MAG: DUF3592 domain-containing protein [Polaribacter sp.]|uniref:DUF3592 domain-containing protein n=1 Tax=Polaribacter sp. TaxID=1920175 RepID=UPI002F352A55